jgi:segregation and condensation protein A
VPFHVRLANFDGPFDLLLQLIGQHRMDVTEVALSRVTDDFIAHIRSMGNDWDLEQATEFLVVAATLLDLKAARLLPDADAADVEDLALLEARDLLFARLLAYRAYQQVAALFRELEASALRRYPRAVTLEGRYLGLLPEVRLGLDPAGFAVLAAAVFLPKPTPVVGLEHIHASTVSVAEHTAAMRALLTERGVATFSELVAGCTRTLEVVARFLGLLNLYRESLIAFDQPEPLGVLAVRWTGDGDTGAGMITDEEYE